MESAAAVLGRKWHPAIIYHLLESEPLRFSELEERMHTVSGKVLSESLEDLEEKGLVKRDVSDGRPVRVAYRLSDQGQGLLILSRCVRTRAVQNRLVRTPELPDSVFLRPGLDG